MKKALLLAGFILCVTGLHAADDERDQAAEGKKRNEQMYEQMLRQTGWSDEKANPQKNTEVQPSSGKVATPSQLKSS